MQSFSDFVVTTPGQGHYTLSQEIHLLNTCNAVLKRFLNNGLYKEYSYKSTAKPDGCKL